MRLCFELLALNAICNQLPINIVLDVCNSPVTCLTFQSLAVCTNSLYVTKFYIIPTEYLYLLYVSQEKH
jgi:hypothetical protein